MLNLTIRHAHFRVIERCLQANKDVFSEKPLALSVEDAFQKLSRVLSAPVRLWR